MQKNTLTSSHHSFTVPISNNSLTICREMLRHSHVDVNFAIVFIRTSTNPATCSHWCHCFERKQELNVVPPPRHPDCCIGRIHPPRKKRNFPIFIRIHRTRTPFLCTDRYVVGDIRTDIHRWSRRDTGWIRLSDRHSPYRQQQQQHTRLGRKRTQTGTGSLCSCQIMMSGKRFVSFRKTPGWVWDRDRNRNKKKNGWENKNAKNLLLK